jgi:hypothetical protein
MLVKLLEGFVRNVGLAALIMSAGLLILICTRDAFEVDTRPREERDPTGGVRRTWEWKYMSDFAENARLELLHLVHMLRLVVASVVVLAVCFFVFAGVLGILDWLGAKEWVEWWQGNSYVKLIFEHGVGLLLLIFGPIILFRLARTVSNVVRARDDHTANKAPWWT